METKKTKVKVWKLGWNKMEHISINVDYYPKAILKVDDWYSPQKGELCFNHKGQLDIVKNITRGDTHNGLFKPHNSYSFELNNEKCSDSLVNRIEVKRGKVFVFNGKVFVHQEALCGSYIDKIARNQPITEIID